MTPHPGSGGGARVKGTYTLEPEEFRYVFSPEFVPPQWVDELDGLFLSWGNPAWGDDSAFRGYEVEDRGADLWRLDADDNPIPVARVTAIERRAGSHRDQPPRGDILGERGGAVQLAQQPSLVVTRYLSFPAKPAEHYALGVNVWTIRALRVEGETIVQGGSWDIQMVTATEPTGPFVTTGVFPVFTSSYQITDPDYVWDLQTPSVAGLRQSLALLVSMVQKISADGLGQAWYLAVWIFDPFDPAGLADPGYSVITRQPDALVPAASLGLDDADVGAWRVSRLSDTEAAVTFSNVSTGVVTVVRLSDAGGVLGTSTADYQTQDFVSLPQPHYMGEGVVHSGDLRVDTTSELQLPTPHYEGVSLTSTTSRIDDRYLFIRRDADELAFVFRDLATGEEVEYVTSDGTVDVEVFALAEQLIRPAGPFGAVGEHLFASYRHSGTYNERFQVVTIELGGSRGLATVLKVNERYFRLPEGLVTS